MGGQVRRMRGLVAHAPPPGYFLHLEETSAEYNLYVKKRTRMRRWLCCNCHGDEPYPSNDNEYLKNPPDYADGHPKSSKASTLDKTEVQKAPPAIEVPALSSEELKEKTDNFGSKSLIGEGS